MSTSEIACQPEPTTKTLRRFLNGLLQRPIACLWTSLSSKTFRQSTKYCAGGGRHHPELGLPSQSSTSCAHAFGLTSFTRSVSEGTDRMMSDGDEASLDTSCPHRQRQMIYRISL